MPADQQLSKSLKPRHLSMIAIAGVIGAGLFVGSGAAIQQAGHNIFGNGHGHKSPTSAEYSIKTLSDSVAHFQQDAPTCPNCGHVAVRNGACYKCLNCGESLGCS